MGRIVRVVLGCVVFLVLAGNTLAADLKITVNNLRGASGTLYVALFDAADSFPNGHAVAGQYLAISAASADAAFLHLKPGRYAVSVFQDENGNGKLDTNLLGVPTERFGFSRDAMGSMGPPTFDAAAVDVSNDAAITINLR